MFPRRKRGTLSSKQEIFLEKARFEMFIPYAEGITDSLKTRQSGFQGESLRLYVLIYTNDEKLSEERDFVFSSLKFDVQLVLYESGTSVVENANGKILAPRSSLMSNGSSDFDDIYNSAHYTRGNNFNNKEAIDGGELETGYRHSPSRRRWLSFVSDEMLQGFEEPEYIYKIVIPVRVQEKFINERLRLVITASPSRFSSSHTPSVASGSVYMDDGTHQTGRRDSCGKPSPINHREMLHNIIEHSVHNLADVPQKQLSSPFKVLAPLAISVHTSSLNMISYISITAKNTHPSLSIVVSDIQFLLNTTLSLNLPRMLEHGNTAVDIGEEAMTPTSAIESFLQVRTTAIEELPLQLNSLEEYCFVLQIEPVPFATTVHTKSRSGSLSSSILGNEDIDVQSNFVDGAGHETGKATDEDGAVLTEGTFQTQCNIFWRVLCNEESRRDLAVIGEAKDAKGEETNNLVSTIKVNWSRKENNSSNNKILVEIDCDAVVVVNTVFTARVALTNISGEVLENLVLIVPEDDADNNFYQWKEDALCETHVESRDVNNFTPSASQCNDDVGQRLEAYAQILGEGKTPIALKSTFVDVDLTSAVSRKMPTPFHKAYRALPSPDGVTSFHATVRFCSSSKLRQGSPTQPCILSINADNLRVSMPNTEEGSSCTAKKWSLLMLEEWNVYSLSKKEFCLELEDEEILFYVRDVSPILSRFESVRAILGSMKKNKSSNSKRGSSAENANDENVRRKKNFAPTVVCLEASLPVGHVLPGDTACVDLHFIPLRTGNLCLNCIEACDSSSCGAYKMRKPCEISVLPQSLVPDVFIGLKN